MTIGHNTTPEEIKVTSDFALIDIKAGRAKVAKVLGEDWKVVGSKPTHKIPITLKGFIVEQYSADDGVSREFAVDVTSVKLGKPVKR